jgi:hypothetical protein
MAFRDRPCSWRSRRESSWIDRRFRAQSAVADLSGTDSWDGYRRTGLRRPGRMAQDSLERSMAARVIPSLPDVEVLGAPRSGSSRHALRPSPVRLAPWRSIPASGPLMNPPGPAHCSSSSRRRPSVMPCHGASTGGSYPSGWVGRRAIEGAPAAAALVASNLEPVLKVMRTGRWSCSWRSGGTRRCKILRRPTPPRRTGSSCSGTVL